MTGGVTATSAEPSGVLISIRSRHVRSIVAGTKTHELRRKIPRVLVGMSIFIYSSGEDRAVTARAEVAEVVSGPPRMIWSKYEDVLGITREEFDRYFLGAEIAHALRLDNVTVSKSPVTLEQLRSQYDIEPPQSWRYLSSDSMNSFLSQLS